MNATISAHLTSLVGQVNQTASVLSKVGDAVNLQGTERTQARDKFVQEAALFLLVAGRAARHDPWLVEARLLSTTLEHLASLVDPLQCLDALRTFPQAALAFGPLAAALDHFGQRKHPMCAAVREASGASGYGAVERLPFRQLEALWLRRLLGQSSNGIASVTRASIIGSGAHACFMRTSDFYARTHCAMYATDFGRLAPPQLAPGRSAQLSSELDHDTALTLMTADWDLLGEVLLAARYWFSELSSWHLTGERALGAVFEKFGYLPTRTYNVGWLASLAEEYREPYRLFHSYHTGIVYGLLLISQVTNRGMHVSPNPDASGRAAEIVAHLASLDSMSSLTGSGLDGNWYAASFGNANVDEELIADGLLVRLFREGGVDALKPLFGLTLEAPDTGRLADTWSILEAHLAFAERITKNLGPPRASELDSIGA